MHAPLNAMNGSAFSSGPSVARPMTLLEAAVMMERLQNRAAHAGELEALRIARDALLVCVAEGDSTLADRLHRGANETRTA